MDQLVCLVGVLLCVSGTYVGVFLVEVPYLYSIVEQTCGVHTQGMCASPGGMT